MVGKSKVSSLFALLVLGGSAIAAAVPAHSTEVTAESSQPECLVELHVKMSNGTLKTSCLDAVTTDSDILIAVKKAQQEAVCITPFCGCWLG